MTTLSRIAIAFTFAAAVAGCAGVPATTPSAVVTAARKKVIEPERMKHAVTIGKSTKAEVVAALGETLVISFDSGYEVWVYRLANAPAAEFVLLFAPSGVVAKARGAALAFGSGRHSAALRPGNDSAENQGFPPKPPFLTFASVASLPSMNDGKPPGTT